MTLSLWKQSGQTSMAMTVPAHAARLTVRIWDRFGDHVRTLVDEANPSAGHWVLSWDWTDDAGRAPASRALHLARDRSIRRPESRLVILR